MWPLSVISKYDLCLDECHGVLMPIKVPSQKISIRDSKGEIAILFVVFISKSVSFQFKWFELYNNGMSIRVSPLLAILMIERCNSVNPAV